MSKRSALAKSELEVARIVWKLGEATVRQVHEALPKRRKIDFWTVQTYLRRLKTKGYLHSRREGQALVYSSAVQPQQVVREVLDDLIGRLFDGHTLPLVHHLLADGALSDADIDELQCTLDRLKREPKS
jgi:BlaI family penicillinase repressor